MHVVMHVGRAKVGPMHGKESKVFHDQETILKDVPILSFLLIDNFHPESIKM